MHSHERLLVKLIGGVDGVNGCRFLVSFVVDARGGAMRGLRHSGVRIIVPPARTCQPTRVTCKLVRVEKVDNPPPLCEGEALASRILKMGPIGAKFTGSVDFTDDLHYCCYYVEDVCCQTDLQQLWRQVFCGCRS